MTTPDGAVAPRWNFPPAPDTSRLRPANLPSLIARMLAARGIDTHQKLQDFLNPPDLHDPMLLAGMTAATQRLRRAVADGETAAVFGDFDVDGITGAAIIYEGLTPLGVAVLPYLPTRADEGHGLSEAALDQLIDAGATLIITVDTGITDSAPVAHANRRGADVIITDHHVPSHGELPPAIACVNPLLTDREASLFPYPSPNLCGAGIAFKLMQGLHQSIGQPCSPALLELAALGTVADLVPLLDENRYIVSQGIRQIAQTRRPGLRALFQTANLSPDIIDTETIAFQIAPRLNSAGRMGNPIDSFKLLTTQSPDEAAALARDLDELNQQRRKATGEAMAAANAKVAALPILPALLVVDDESILPGVAGLVAGRLAEQYRRPAVALSLSDTHAVASARSIPGFSIIAAINSIADLLVRHGGHDQAAGFTIARPSLDEAKRRLQEYAAQHLATADLTPTISIDAMANLSELTKDVQESLAALEPFGKGNPRPVFASRNVRVAESQFMGHSRQHLRLRLEQEGATMTALAFGQGDAWIPGTERLDLAYTLMDDTRLPGNPLALRVTHSRPATPQ